MSVGCLSACQKIIYSPKNKIRVSTRTQTFVYQRPAVSPRIQRPAVSPRIQKNSADLRPQADGSAVGTSLVLTRELGEQLSSGLNSKLIGSIIISPHWAQGGGTSVGLSANCTQHTAAFIYPVRQHKLHPFSFLNNSQEH